ncbi:MAG: leucine-rich repeat protein [Prevotella sp.]|nr:leucine-rich repeat protein [Prevotella sp.]
MKKFRLLLAAMLAFVFTTGVWAQTITTSSGITYTIQSGYAYVTKVSEGKTTVTFPSGVYYNSTDYTVRGFSSTTNLENLHCDTWMSVTFPQYFTSFKVKYDSESTETVWATRYFTNVTSVIFDYNSPLTALPDDAFYECYKLQTIQLPAGITKLGAGCFAECQDLTTITNTSNITDIGEKAFWGCASLTSISLPKVKNIYEETFNHCSSLASVTLDECQTIGVSAFSNCTNLKAISLPNTLTFISDRAFSSSSFNEITFPASLLYIGEHAFSSIKKINIEGERVLPVHPSFIWNASNVTVNVIAGTIPAYKKLDGWSNKKFSFVETGEKTIKVRAGSNYNPMEIWSDSEQLATIPLEGGEVTVTVTVPQDLEFRVPQYAFNKFYVDGVAKSYSSATPTSSPYAGVYKFYTVRIVSGMETIEVRYNRISEEGISFADPAAEAACVARWDSNHDGKLNPSEVKSLGTFPAGVIGAEVTSFNELSYFNEAGLAESAFEGCVELTSIMLPPNLTTIPKKCFKGDVNLPTIHIPQSVTGVSNYAFDGCTSLQSIFIPKNLTSFAVDALINCTSLSSIVVDEHNTKYDSRGNCNAIISTSDDRLEVGCKSTRIPNDIKNIAPTAFSGISGLTAIELPATLTDIGFEAFSGCSGLTSVVAKMLFPDAVELGTDAFKGISDNCVLTVPAGTRDAYIAAGWTEDIFKGGVVESSSGGTLEDYVYNGTVAGGLYNELSTYTDDQLKAIRTLTVNSPINSADLFIIRKLCGDATGNNYQDFGLDLLDLTNVTIVADNGIGTIPYYGNKYIMQNGIMPERMFFKCVNLKELKLPENVSMNDEAAGYVFLGTKSDMIVHAPWSTPAELQIADMGNGVYYSYAFGMNTDADVKGMTLVVPKGSLAAYQAAQGWNWFNSIVEESDAAPKPNDKLIALLAPSNGEDMLIINSEGDILYWGHETGMLELTKGGSYKVLVTNTHSYYYDLHLYVNGDDRTDELALDPVYNRLMLNLENVTENILVKVKYTDKQWSVPVVASAGGTIKAHFTGTNDVAQNRTLLEGTGTNFNDIKPGTDITFTFQPEQGYELGLVFCDYNRLNTEEVQLQADGTYQFVLHADQVVNGKTTVAAIYKKVGADTNYDINGDGFVTITDAVLIVNKILNP